VDTGDFGNNSYEQRQFQGGNSGLVLVEGVRSSVKRATNYIINFFRCKEPYADHPLIGASFCEDLSMTATSKF
jgi:hypothetical protein